MTIFLDLVIIVLLTIDKWDYIVAAYNKVRALV